MVMTENACLVGRQCRAV